MVDINTITFDNFSLLDSKTRKEVINNTEYLKIILKKNLNDHRYKHSLEVAKFAAELAIAHGVDVNKAYLAGLLHDCTKCFDEQFHDNYLKYYDKDKLKLSEGVKHSFTAKYYLKEKLHMHDKDVLNAIYNHTLCLSNDKLSKIVYIADKREPSRNIDDDIADIAFKDLNLAYNLLTEEVSRYLKGRGIDEDVIGNC